MSQSVDIGNQETCVVVRSVNRNSPSQNRRQLKSSISSYLRSYPKAKPKTVLLTMQDGCGYGRHQTTLADIVAELHADEINESVRYRLAVQRQSTDDIVDYERGNGHDVTPEYVEQVRAELVAELQGRPTAALLR